MQRLLSVIVALATLVLAVPASVKADTYQHPVLRVHKFSKAPVIDGAINPREWAEAPAFTGVVGGPYSTRSLIPEFMQQTWYIGYDDQYLYVAMHSLHRKGTYPNVKVKTDDNEMMRLEEHLEIEICTRDRATAKIPGQGFYKVMLNPKDSLADQYKYNGTPATEDLWSTGGAAKSRVTDSYWDMELKIELRRMKLDSLEGRDLVMQVLRTDVIQGPFFAGWVAAPKHSFEVYGEVSFDSTAPIFKMKKIGEMMQGRLDTEVSLTGTLDKPVPVDVLVSVEDADGKTIYSKTESAIIGKGETKALTWQAAKLPITSMPHTAQKRNYYYIKATYKDGETTRTLYENRSPFMMMDKAYHESYLDPWLKTRQRAGTWEARFAHLPYARKAQVSVDLDFFGLSADMAGAKTFSVSVTPEGKARVLGSGKGSVSKPMLVDLPDIPNGSYEATITLYSGSGKKVGQKVVPFVRKHYPWEDNKIGVSNEVIPPFMPITVNEQGVQVWNHEYQNIVPEKGNTILTWGRTYLVGKGGLLDQIWVAPPTGNVGEIERLLLSPMRLEITSGGNSYTGEGGSVNFPSAKPHNVDVVGSQQFGPVKATLKGFEEYDGWYQVALTLDAAKGTKVDAVDMVVDLRDNLTDKTARTTFPIDTLYVQRMGGPRYGNVISGISREPGVVFKSTDLLRIIDAGNNGVDPVKDWMSFVPSVFVGNGDRGLYFYAWSDEGWQMKEGDPAVTVERLADGNVRLRVRFISGPLVFNGPRTVEFALQALPVKPNNARYRTIRDEEGYTHDTAGWRFFGDSTDGYKLNSPEEYDALRRFILYGNRDIHGRGEDIYAWYTNGKLFLPIQNGSKVVQYGSTWFCGLGMEEFDSFGGEWLGTNTWQCSRNGAHLRGWWNRTGTVQWNTDRQVSDHNVNWTQSMTDNYIYYHKPLMEKSGFNGTWWDNSNLWTIREYDPKMGKMTVQWNQLQRRQLCKRLNVLGWQMMRPPMWVQHAHTDFSWTQIFWMVEGDYYAYAKDVTALMNMTLDEWRAMTRTRTTMLIPEPSLHNFQGTTPEMDRKVKRSLVGVMLSMDVQGLGYEYPQSAVVDRELQYLLDLSDTVYCQFAGYWQTARVVQPGSTGICASYYRNEKRKAAVLVLLNGEKQDLSIAGTTVNVGRVLGVTPKLKRVYDLETKEPIAYTADGDSITITDTTPLPWHDYRLIAFESD